MNIMEKTKNWWSKRSKSEKIAVVGVGSSILVAAAASVIFRKENVDYVEIGGSI